MSSILPFAKLCSEYPSPLLSIVIIIVSCTKSIFPDSLLSLLHEPLCPILSSRLLEPNLSRRILESL